MLNLTHNLNLKFSNLFHNFSENDEHIEMYELPSNTQTPQNQHNLYKSGNMTPTIHQHTPNSQRNIQHSNQYNQGKQAINYFIHYWIQNGKF